MKIFRRLTAAVIAASCAAGTAATAAPETGERVTVIVEVKGDAVLEAKAAQDMGAKLFCATDEAADIEGSIRQTQASVQSDIRERVDKKAETGYTYTHVLNGFSMEVNETDIPAIKALPNVENVYISRAYELCDEPDSGEEMYLDPGCEMMHMEYMHENGYTGKGTVIAVVDTGFDPSHENFQGAIEAPKLSRADIADKIENENLSINSIGGNVTVNRVYRSEKIPYAYNYYTKNSDTYDITIKHGQHVAGIAAGNNGTNPQGGKFVGAAPDAQLLLLSCGAGRSIYPEAEYAAIDDAVKLGADVVNASFGADYRENDVPQEKVINNVVRAGILFSTSGGNSSRGYNELTPLAENIDYSANGVPSTYAASTSVASIDNNIIWHSNYKMTVDGRQISFSEGNESVSFAERFSDRQYDFVFAGYGLESDFDGIDAEGRIAVMLRGMTTFAMKTENAQNAGAIGIILVNVEDEFYFDIVQDMIGDMPYACVSLADLEKLTGAAETKLQTDTEIAYDAKNPNEYAMSSFSSWGTTSSLELKPEITAPGGKIYSSVYDDKYENMDGTSMAAPHISGAAAVMSQYITEHPEKYGTVENKVQLTENLMMSSADVVMQDKENNIPYSPRNQGAGLIDLEKAAKTPVVLIGDTYTVADMEIEKSKISLKEIEDTFTVDFIARNFTGTDVEYDGIDMTVITDDADANGYVSGMRKLSFNAQLPEKVTVPAKSEAKVSVPVTLDKAETSENMKVFKNGFYVDGFVFLTSNDEDIPEISIPFMGFYGDWDSAPALDKPYFSSGSVLRNTYMCYDTTRTSNGSYGKEHVVKIAGTNLFIEDGANDAAEYESEDFVGYSPNNDGNADEPAIALLPLRKLGRNDYSICDTEGKELLANTHIIDGTEHHSEKLTRSYLYFDSIETNALPDGDYIFKSKAGFVHRDPYEQNESMELRFYIDREKPVITRIEKSSDGRELTVAAADNRYIMGFVLSGTRNGEKFTEVYPVKGLSEAEHTFSIEGVDEGSLSVETVDYAQNSSVRSESGLYFEQEKASGTSFLFKVYNTTGQKINADVIMALYAGDKLVGTAAESGVIPNGESYKSFNTDSNVNYDKIKIFVWDSLNGMEPLYEKFEY